MTRAPQVSEDNKAEYLDLFVKHRLVGCVSQQLDAVRAGLGVFVDLDLMRKVRQCLQPVEVKTLLAGSPTIDVADWEAHTVYMGYTQASPVVRWFWEAVGEFESDDRAKLLQFCTGSSAPPAAGFARLQGYSGQQHKFCIQFKELDAYGITAATCFNTIRLPSYASKSELKEKLLLVARQGPLAFEEAAR